MYVTSGFWNSQNIVEALDLKAMSSPLNVSGISIDTRTLKEGDLYIALHGENGDGHLYIPQAFEKGACGVILSSHAELVPSNGTFFKVEDTQQALQALGTYARLHTNPQTVAITGSAGKTTLKEWISRVLSAFGETIFSQKSFNNHLGVPLSLAHLTYSARYGVFEIGMNHTGEIASLARMVRPHVACITNIAAAHIGYFSNMDEIAEEKSDIFCGFAQDIQGIAVLSRDDIYFDFLSQKAIQKGAKKIIGVGRHEHADIRLVDIKHLPHAAGMHLNVCFFGENISYKLPFIGEHFALNSLFVLATSKAFELALPRVLSVLSALEVPSGRGCLHSITRDQTSFLLIDDAYNANPASMRASLINLGQMPCTNRRIAVLGDMRELGGFSQKYHAELAPVLQQGSVDILITVGQEMQHLQAVTTLCEKQHFETYAGVSEALQDMIQTGDVVLIKASRGIALDHVVNDLRSWHTHHVEVA